MIIRNTEFGQPCWLWGEAGSRGEEPEVVGDAPPEATGGARDIAPPAEP